MKSSHEIINVAAQKFKEAVIFGLHYYLQEKSSSLIRPSLYANMRHDLLGDSSTVDIQAEVCIATGTESFTLIWTRGGVHWSLLVTVFLGIIMFLSLNGKLARPLTTAPDTMLPTETEMRPPEPLSPQSRDH